MLILARTRLACRILNYLANCPGGVAKQDDIARAVSAPKPYTGKVARELLSAGFVKSVRGYQGGFALAIPASSIRVGDVVQFIDDRRSWRSRLLLADTGMNTALKEAQQKFFDVLNTCSIADLCGEVQYASALNSRVSCGSVPAVSSPARYAAARRSTCAWPGTPAIPAGSSPCKPTRPGPAFNASR